MSARPPGAGPRNRFSVQSRFMNFHRTTATRLETKHASQVVLEPLLSYVAIAT
jgi:hypothetical protein